jgi:hypothetical protein
VTEAEAIEALRGERNISTLRRRLPGSAAAPLRSCLDQEAVAAQDATRQRAIAVQTLAFASVKRTSPSLLSGDHGRRATVRVHRRTRLETRAVLEEPEPNERQDAAQGKARAPRDTDRPSCFAGRMVDRLNPPL